MKFFLFLLLSVYSIKLSIIKTGLIYFPNGFQLLKFHDIILLEHKNDKIVIDFIPEIKNKYDIWKLLIGKNIPGKIRIRKIPENILDKDMYSFLCSPTAKAITNTKVNSWILKLFLYRIKNWGNLQKNNYTMNFYKRNCQHYRYFVEQEYKNFSN
jgi:hypothetical protein